MRVAPVAIRVQFPTETLWGALDIPEDTKADIVRTCSEAFLEGIFAELRNPKIVFFVGNDAFEWLKRRKDFARSNVQGDPRTDMDWSLGSGANPGNYCVIRYQGKRFYAIINPRPSVIRDEGLTSELVQNRFLLPEDINHT